MEQRDLEYYLGLAYVIEVIPIPEAEGGGYTARLPQVGRLAITGDGESPQEAIANLEAAKRERFIEYLKKGIRIPEPEEEIEEYSGRFVVRLPKVLHRQLAAEAKKNEISLNQYVSYLLASNFQLKKQEEHFGAIMDELEIIRDEISDIYSFHWEYKIKEQNKEQADIFLFPKLKAA